jgi:2-haloacid dehalogenase
MAKHVVFDVVGTLVSFHAFYTRIEVVLGDKLRSQGIKTSLFGYTWMTTAELEFTFLSISSRHTTYNEVMKAMFYRTLWQCGISSPRSFATDEERDRCQEGYSMLTLREGARECVQMLRDAGFNVWCLTTANPERVRAYFERGGMDMPPIVSCDEKGVAKPQLAAYRSVLDKFDQDDERWFAACHAWDVSAARVAGFKGAYCSAYENEPCWEIYGGKMEVVEETLVEMARSIIQRSIHK